MRNQEVSRIFQEIARILDLKGENPFRVRAYEKAARNIESLGEDLEALWREGKLTSLSGIGKDLASKIEEILKTGTLSFYEELKKDTPSGLIAMMEIPGLGPRTVKTIYERLKIDNIDALEEAARKGLLRNIEGIKEKTEENILRGIRLIKEGKSRTPLYYALGVAQEFLEPLKRLKTVRAIEIAGSLRRRKDTVKDIDILTVSSNPQKVMDTFVSLEGVKEVLAKGETKSSIIARQRNMQVDLRVVEEKSFGAALLYFTGSRQFNIKLRTMALKHGYKINEYGIFLTSGRKSAEGKMVAGGDEKSIFQLFKMKVIPPELREDRGEIEAALKGKLPSIVSPHEIKGDLHVHSRYSDGTSTIEEIAKEALKRGYKFIAITDHSQSLKVAGGLDKKTVYRKLEEIKKLNQRIKGIRILCGTEVDILSDGRLDYPDSILKEFDVVIAAIHTGFKQSRKQLTRRILSACKSRYVHIIAHPTGRLWGTRESYDIDLEEIAKAACDNGVALELNCSYDRYDLNDEEVFRIKRKGLKFALGTDAHMLEQLKAMDLGVSIARRGWLTKGDLLNCMEVDKLLKWLRK